MTEDTSRPTPTADDIKNALSKTGFLLEYHVAQSLRQRKFYVDIGRAYPDPETGKSREIDVFASMDRDVRRQPVSVTITTNLIIECKNSSGPFVLIGDHGQDYTGIDASVILSFDPLHMGFPKIESSSKVKLRLDHLPGSATQDDFMGYQLLRVNRQNNVWKADNSSIYDSILYPLAKAWSHEIKLYRESDEDGGYQKWEYPFLTYVHPIIVTSGQVFAVDVTTGEPDVSEVKWARVRRDFKSRELDCNLRADVVSFSHWEEYVDARIMKIMNSAHDTIAKNVHLFDPEWLLTNCGEPKYKDYFYEWLNDVRKERNRK